MPSRVWNGVVVRHRITQLSKSISQSKTHFSATHENQFTFLPLFSHASLTLSLSPSQLVFLCLLLLRHFLDYVFAVLLIVCFPPSVSLCVFSPIFIILCAARRKPLLNETNNTSAVVFVCVCVVLSCTYVVQCRRSCSSWENS